MSDFPGVWVLKAWVLKAWVLKAWVLKAWVLKVWVLKAWILRSSISLGLLAFAALAGAGTISAQDRRQNAPGEFDFYVLSLSWSPSFCEAASERGGGGRSQIQCGGRGFFFRVAGVWPPYEHGLSGYFQRPAPPLDPNIMSSMLGLMPAPGLIFAAWGNPATCSRLG